MNVPRPDTGGTDAPLVFDQGVPDVIPDRGDLTTPDSVGPDTVKPDLPRSDFALPDSPKPDLFQLDLPLLDLSLPDLPLPDLSLPDLPQPDTYVPKCENGVLDPGEQCDGKLFNNKTCKDFKYDGGSLTCMKGCTIGYSGCYKCGDGKINSGEDCDGAQLGGQTCKSLKMSGGTLACKTNCSFDYSDCTWLVSAGSMYMDYSHGIAVDSVGNSFITGRFKGQFGSTTLTSKGSEDMFVVKLGPSGKVVWARSVGDATGRTLALDLTVDVAGNSYVTGYFSGTNTSFGSTTLSSQGLDDIFVTKLNSAGTFLWAKSMGGKSHVQGRGIALDDKGNIFLTGTFQDKASFQKVKDLWAQGTYNSSDVFAAKLDPSGKVLWVRQAGGVYADYVRSIVADSTGCTVTGSFSSAATFFGTTAQKNLTAAKIDMYVARWDSSGKIRWVANSGVDIGANAFSVALDKTGNSYVAGNYSGTAAFGTTTLTTKGLANIFVAKLNSKGQFIWATSATGSQTKLGMGIARSPQGQLLISGRFSGTASFGTTVLKSNGSTDVFVARLDPTGKFLGAIKGGATATSTNLEVGGHDIAVDGAGNSFTTGLFQGTLAHGATSLSSNTGSVDAFVWKQGKNTP